MDGTSSCRHRSRRHDSHWQVSGPWGPRFQLLGWAGDVQSTGDVAEQVAHPGDTSGNEDKGGKCRAGNCQDECSTASWAADHSHEGFLLVRVDPQEAEGCTGRAGGRTWDSNLPPVGTGELLPALRRQLLLHQGGMQSPIRLQLALLRRDLYWHQCLVNTKIAGHTSI